MTREEFSIVTTKGDLLFGLQAETCVMFSALWAVREQPYKLHQGDYPEVIPILRDSPNAIIRRRFCELTPWYVSGGGGSA